MRNSFDMNSYVYKDSQILYYLNCCTVTLFIYYLKEVSPSRTYARARKQSLIVQYSKNQYQVSAFYY